MSQACGETPYQGASNGLQAEIACSGHLGDALTWRLLGRGRLSKDPSRPLNFPEIESIGRFPKLFAFMLNRNLATRPEGYEKLTWTSAGS